MHRQVSYKQDYHVVIHILSSYERSEIKLSSKRVILQVRFALETFTVMSKVNSLKHLFLPLLMLKTFPRYILSNAILSLTVKN